MELFHPIETQFYETDTKRIVGIKPEVFLLIRSTKTRETKNLDLN